MGKCKSIDCQNETEYGKMWCKKCYDKLGNLIEEHPIGFTNFNPSQNTPTNEIDVIFDIAKLFYPSMYKYEVSNIDIVGFCKDGNTIKKVFIGINYPSGWKLTKQIRDKLTKVI